MPKAALFTLLFAVALSAQKNPGFHNNEERSLRCEDHSWNSGQERFCEVREQTVPASGSLRVDAGANGGISIKGWNRADVLVRSKVEASADSAGEARSLVSSVAIQTSGGNIHPSGPEMHGHGGWSVSFEVFVPHATNLNAKANNGGLHVQDVGGTLELGTVNGGLHLARVMGDVHGETVNGGVHVELTGDHWEGRGLDVSSTNGGVHLALPDGYSARLESSTVNGGVHSDFADLATEGRHGRQQSIQANLGRGGALVRATTVNGGVSIGKVGMDKE